MNRIALGASLVAALLLGSCSTTPTQEEIEEDLESRLRSAVGPWHGSGFAEEFLSLNFTLATQGDSLAGAGWQRFGDPVDSTAITVHGTYHRPALALTFEGIAWRGETGRAVFRGEYLTVGGVLDTLHIATPGHTGAIDMLLTEL